MFNCEGQLHGTHRSQLWEWLQRHICKPLPGRWWMCISPSANAAHLWLSLRCWLLCWSVVAPGSGGTETEARPPPLIVCLGMFFFAHLRFRAPYKSIQWSFLRLLPSSTPPCWDKKKKIQIKVFLCIAGKTVLNSCQLLVAENLLRIPCFSLLQAKPSFLHTVHYRLLISVIQWYSFLPLLLSPFNS